MPTIRPTHRCFDDVLDYQVALRRRDPAAAARQVIVHGICLAPEGPRAGEPFAHAWVEDDAGGGIVYQSGFINGEHVWFGLPRDEWRAAVRVQAESRYTLEAAIVLNWQHGHYGPWVATYRALCGRGSRIAYEEA